MNITRSISPTIADAHSESAAEHSPSESQHDIHEILRWRLSDATRAQLDKYRVRYFAKNASLWWRVIGWVFPLQLENIWTTWRWPFGDPQVWVPEDALFAPNHTVDQITIHELHHVKQISTWWGYAITVALSVLPPVGPGGKWLVERRAYLLGVRSGWMKPEVAAELISSSVYFCGWPYSWAKAWFEKHKDTPDDGRLW